MVILRSGDLIHRITLQKPAIDRDTYGSKNRTYEDVATIYAALWPISGNEYYVSRQERASISHKIRIRYRPDIKINWRIKYKNRYFNIESIIDHNERNILLDIMCSEEIA